MPVKFLSYKNKERNTTDKPFHIILKYYVLSVITLLMEIGGPGQGIYLCLYHEYWLEFWTSPMYLSIYYLFRRHVPTTQALLSLL